jgi:hypothetical protein
MSVKTFNARGSDGRMYQVYEVTRSIPAGTYDDPGATIDGLPSYQLSDGRKLNKVDEHTFEIVGGDISLVVSL